ncbi:MAG: DNA methyltransferase [Tepidisphaeraceae bacterium]
MSKKQKLELTWIGKEHRPRLEPRVLVEDTQLSYHADKRLTDRDLFDNRLIFGDNLLALKALEQEFAGKIKCIYIDPPYNTGSAFDHYDDGVEHSLWLSLMRDRLEILWRLLTDDGSLWVSIDDSEMPYLKVLLDEICGRASFIACNVWQKRYSRENREAIGDAHEYILVYGRNPETFKSTRNLLPLGEKQRSVYKNRNNDPKGPWRGVSFSAQGFRPNQMYEIVSPITGKKHKPPAGSCWKVIESEYRRLLAEGRMYFGKDGKPFMLVVAEDTTHASHLRRIIEAHDFFAGQYKGKVAEVHSNQRGEERDENVQKLLAIENPDDTTEVVIHVDQLKEGWDVTNLYTIVPLRAFNSRTLIEQAIGRGLRLPYHRRRHGFGRRAMPQTVRS